MPLIPYIQEVLLAEKSQQEKMRRTMRKAYSKKYLDYVCVDALGEILTPQYVTRHFKFILRHNGLKNIRFHDLRHSLRVHSARPQRADEDDSGLAGAFRYEHDGGHLQPHRQYKQACERGSHGSGACVRRLKNGAKKAPKIGVLAQREGFEPPDVAINSFQDCRNRPLYHLCIKLLR